MYPRLRGFAGNVPIYDSLQLLGEDSKVRFHSPLYSFKANRNWAQMHEKFEVNALLGMNICCPGSKHVANHCQISPKFML
jgi:hypothetical protein